MLKEEFEARVGIEVDTDTYIEIEKVYMDSPLDKDAFCKKAKRDNLIIKVQHEQIKKLNAVICQLADMAARKKRAADELNANNRDRELIKVARLKINQAEMYGYNRQLMSLAETVAWGEVLEVIDPADTRKWKR